jgi:DNA phosphorothioation-dependent restriction protein DptG
MLPKLDVPIHELKLVSSGKTIRFRPFLVKEQKLFLMASESEDPKETVKVIRQVIKNCVLDEIDIDSLPSFDLELNVEYTKDSFKTFQASKTTELDFNR